MRDTQSYLDTFGVSMSGLERVMSEVMGSGASYGDLYFEKSTFTNIVRRDSKFSSCGYHIDYGVGMRALKGEKTGYAYCETTDMTAMLKAARAAAAISCNSGAGRLAMAVKTSGQTWLHPAGPSGEGYYSNLRPWHDCDRIEISGLLSRLEAMTLARDSRISKFTARISFSESTILQFNCLGELCGDFRPMGTLMASIAFTDGKTADRRNCSRSFHCGAEMLTDRLLESMVDELCGRMDPMLEAGRPKGGKMKVVLGAGASGILLHEAMGHAFEADFNRKGQSVFSDRMGQRICPKGINIVDDGTWRLNRGACNFDDEGIAGQKTYMVSDGILTSYLHDRISAACYGVAPTGNGRRESFRFNPIPRMRLTYMESGKGNLDDMIADTGNGIYVDEFSNGQVKIGEGDFTFYVKLGFLIENGKLTRPIKDVNIIGNGPRALADILEVGNDLKVNDSCWVCGKEQSAPVGCGMPSVLIKGLTVGGE